jgi:hypothetical protein
MKSEDTVPMLIPKRNPVRAAHFVHSDKTVSVVGEFPELTKAVREGDVHKISVLCGHLFVLNSMPAFRSIPT